MYALFVNKVLFLFKQNVAILIKINSNGLTNEYRILKLKN